MESGGFINGGKKKETRAEQENEEGIFGAESEWVNEKKRIRGDDMQKYTRHFLSSFLFHRLIRRLIGMEVSDLVHTTNQRLTGSNVRSVEELQRLPYPVIGFSEDMHRPNRQLKDFLYSRLYRHYRFVRMAVKAERIICDLFNAYLKEPAILPGHVQNLITEHGLERTTCDYIAGMTDRFAVDEHAKLFEPTMKP